MHEMKYKGCGRKRSWPNQSYSLEIHLQGSRKNHVKPLFGQSVAIPRYEQGPPEYEP
jgi:hypothetical protein